MSIKAGIIGSTGYAGQEVVRLLLGHPDVELVFATSNTYKDQSYSNAYGNYVSIYEEKCVKNVNDLGEIIDNIDVLFLATPHGLSASLVNESLLEKVVIIDLSADFRLKDKDVYAKWYNKEHSSPWLLDKAVYGLSETMRDSVKKSRLIANPGCYPTASALALYPLLKEHLIDNKSIIIDAKSGVSGAGRELKLATQYCEINENTKAYGIAVHRHTPEVEEQLSLISGESIIISFTPHLLPINRGMLITAYANLNSNQSYSDIKAIYDKYYNEELFVRVLDEGIYPETRWVNGSNFCDINFKIDERTNRIIVTAAIDNLVKGAAGQAVQNMNIIFGLEENRGLWQVPMFP